MNLSLQKVLILIACLNIVLFVGGVRVIEDNNALNSFIDTEKYAQNDTVTASDNFKDSVPGNFEKTGETEGLSFIDTLQAVTGFLIFVVNIIFAPIGLFASLPPVAALVVGAPILIGSVVSLLYFIRSGR